MRRSTYVVFGLSVLAAFLGGCGGGSNGGNEGVLSFTSSGYTVNEDGTLGTAITIHREGGGAAIGVTVDFTDGTATSPADYDSTPQVVLWAAGDLADKTIVVPIVDDNNQEPDEFLTMTLTNTTGGAVTGTPDSATLTILNDPNDVAGTIQFSAVSYSYNENGTPVGMEVTVTRVGGIDGDVSVLVTSTDGTANSDPNSVVEPVDYSPVNAVAFFADQTATDVVVSLSIVNDLLPELDEDFTLSLSNATNGATLGAPSVCTVTIIDDDPTETLDKPLVQAGAWFGSSVAKVGQHLAIGAPRCFNPEGRVFIFDPSVPTNDQTLDGGSFAEQFGKTLTLDGSTFAVGGFGSAWVFDTDTFSFSQRFKATSAEAGFGNSLLGLGDGRLVVGAPQAEFLGGGLPEGAIHVYDAFTGTALQTILGAADNEFGKSLGLFGSDLLVGATGLDGSVLRFDGAPLTLNNVLGNPSPSPFPAFGEGIQQLGSAVLVGAPDDDNSALTDDGIAFVIDGATGTMVSVLDFGVVNGGRFGSKIIIIGNRICVSATGEFGNAGRVVTYNATTFAFVEEINCPNPTPGALFGASICEFDGVLVVGAPKQGVGANFEAGNVYIFKLL